MKTTKITELLSNEFQIIIADYLLYINYAIDLILEFVSLIKPHKSAQM